jgi:hypothetical protein
MSLAKELVRLARFYRNLACLPAAKVERNIVQNELYYRILEGKKEII